MKHLLTFCLFLNFIIVFSQIASFTTSPAANNNTITICQGSTVLYTNTSTGTNASTNYNWTFQGGNPASANQVGPHNITYNNPGNYITTLNLGNGVTTQVNISVVANNYTPSLTIPNSSGYSTTTSNGITIFRRCGNFNSGTFSFTDIAFASYPAGTTFNYIWGDNTPNGSGNPNPITHFYNGQGNYNLTYQVTFPGGCTFTQNYNVFVGNNAPTISLTGGFGASCLPNPYSFSIGTQGAVTPGTIFQVIYNDGTPTSYLNGLNPNPQTINHVFAQSSCGINSTIQGTTYPNSYAIQVVATNGCNPQGTFASLGPITVSESVNANIGMSPPNNSQCINQTTVFTDSSNHGNNVNGGSCDSLYGRYWTISPNSGFTTSGNLGSSNGYLPWLPSGYDFTMWSNGSDTLPITWNTPGNYQIILFVGNQCGVDTANIYQLTVSNCQIQNQLIVNPSTVNQIVCSGNTTIPVNWNSNQPNTTTTWILTANPNIVGAIPSGTGTIPSMILTNISNIPQNVVYSTTSTANGLTVNNVHTITVNPTPSVAPVANQVACSNTSMAAISFSGTGTSYTWTNSNTAIGLAASGNGNITSFIATNGTAAPISSTVTVTPVFNYIVNCQGIPTSFTITVNPNTIPTPVNGQTLCNGANSAAITISGTGNSYTWTNTNAAIGLAASGNGNITSFIATNGTAAPISSTVTVTSVFSGGGISCNGGTTSFTINVNPTPSVSGGSNQSVCAGSPVTLSGSGASSYTWSNGISNGVPFVPVATQTYTVIGTDANGCSNTAQVTITVNPLPTISAGADQSICSGDPVTLNGTGGSNYQWNNNVVDGQTFTPNQSANYVVNGTDSLGCQGTDTVVVTVLENAASTLTQTALDSYTLNGQTYTQSGTYTQTLTAANGCDSTITLNLTLNFTGINELGAGAKKLVKITDLNGKNIPRHKNTLMLFIYEDGTVERVLEME